MAVSKISKFSAVRFESGTTGQLSTNANAYSSYTVTFGTPFKTAPHVQLTIKSSFGAVSNAHAVVACLYGNPTTTGFTLRLYNNGSSSLSPEVYWLAVGE